LLPQSPTEAQKKANTVVAKSNPKTLDLKNQHSLQKNFSNKSLLTADTSSSNLLRGKFNFGI
jgi:hypothetical protein